jgi:hypothetical protein
MTTSPPITVALERAIQRALREVHTTIPAMVESYDEDAGTCAAQPLILKGYRGRDGKRKTMRYPVVPSAPVFYLGNRLTFPLTRGDIVLLCVSEACIDRGWDVENDPEDDRRFDLNDAFAFPIVSANGPRIAITEDEIHVGGEEPLALDASLQATISKLNSLIAKHNTHTHAVATTGTASAQTGTAAAITSGGTGVETTLASQPGCEITMGG